MKQTHGAQASALKRLIVATLAGILVGGAVATVGHMGRFSLLAAWDTIAVLFVASVLITLLRFNATNTRTHALQENPGRTTADALLTLASIASLVGIGFLIFQGDDTGSQKTIAIVLGLFSVIVSWAVVHTLYMLKYARLYYGDPEGGVAFGGRTAPRYSDFAYMAFTIGMTFQVSDTALESNDMRTTVLKHAMLSYLFGTVIIATTINTLVTLSQ